MDSKTENDSGEREAERRNCPQGVEFRTDNRHRSDPVEGAEPGDTLAVTWSKIAPERMGGVGACALHRALTATHERRCESAGGASLGIEVDRERVGSSARSRRAEIGSRGPMHGTQRRRAAGGEVFAESRQGRKAGTRHPGGGRHDGYFGVNVPAGRSLGDGHCRQGRARCEGRPWMARCGP